VRRRCQPPPKRAEVPADRAVPQLGERAEVRLVLHLDRQLAQWLGKQKPKFSSDVNLTPAKVRGVRHHSGLSRQARDSSPWTICSACESRAQSPRRADLIAARTMDGLGAAPTRRPQPRGSPV
jgi:hypothetical protein